MFSPHHCHKFECYVLHQQFSVCTTPFFRCRGRQSSSAPPPLRRTPYFRLYNWKTFILTLIELNQNIVFEQGKKKVTHMKLRYRNEMLCYFCSHSLAVCLCLCWSRSGFQRSESESIEQKIKIKEIWLKVDTFFLHPKIYLFMCVAFVIEEFDVDGWFFF
jgi:hypothetical protein